MPAEHRIQGTTGAAATAAATRSAPPLRDILATGASLESIQLRLQTPHSFSRARGFPRRPRIWSVSMRGFRRTSAGRFCALAGAESGADMANFATHIGVGTVASGMLATLTLAADVVAPENLVAVTLAGVLGSVLPDIDLKDSRAGRAMFAGLAAFFSFAVLFTFAEKFSIAELWLMSIGTFLFFRFVVHAIFHRMSYHRGIYHSILAGAVLRVSHRDRLPLPAWPPRRRRLARRRLHVHGLHGPSRARRDLQRRRARHAHKAVVRHRA